MTTEFCLPSSDADMLGFARKPLEQLDRLIRRHIEEERYPGCQIALARDGKLALYRSYGHARVEPHRVPAGDDTLWLLFSNTKVLTMAAVWSLVEDGTLSFSDRVADHIPEFARHGKDEITIFQLATHQGGFPSATVSREAWADHARMRREICDFPLEWPPGSKLHYHPRSAHIVLAMVLEAVTGSDFRDVIATWQVPRVRLGDAAHPETYSALWIGIDGNSSASVEQLGLSRELFVGVPREQQTRCADIHAPPGSDAPGEDSAAFRAAGLPHGGGYGTARAMAAFYQMMLGGGRLGDLRVFSRRMIEYVTRDFTADRPDEYMNGIPMHRGLGPHLRGPGERTRGLGGIASPGTYGHGGVGSSYCWADPASGVSFAYITNFVAPDPWHSARMDRVSNLVHAAIE
jgi:CubicO group peptidase (beta-lactamase class C family)